MPGIVSFRDGNSALARSFPTILTLNGVQTVDFTEKDDKFSQNGIIGLQIHGGGPSEAWYRNITIEELP